MLFFRPNYRTNYFYFLRKRLQRVLLYFCLHKPRGLLSFGIQPIFYKCALCALYKNAGFYKRLALASKRLILSWPILYQTYFRTKHSTCSKMVLKSNTFFCKNKISLFYVIQTTNQTILIIMVSKICLTIRLRWKIC